MEFLPGSVRCTEYCMLQYSCIYQCVVLCTVPTCLETRSWLRAAFGAAMWNQSTRRFRPSRFCRNSTRPSPLPPRLHPPTSLRTLFKLRSPLRFSRRNMLTIRLPLTLIFFVHGNTEHVEGLRIRFSPLFLKHFNGPTDSSSCSSPSEMLWRGTLCP